LADLLSSHAKKYKSKQEAAKIKPINKPSFKAVKACSEKMFEGDNVILMRVNIINPLKKDVADIISPLPQ